VRVARRVREGTCGKRPVVTPAPRPQVYLTHDRVGKTAITSFEDLQHKAETALLRLKQLPDLVRAFFADPDLHYIGAHAV